MLYKRNNIKSCEVCCWKRGKVLSYLLLCGCVIQDSWLEERRSLEVFTVVWVCLTGFMVGKGAESFVIYCSVGVSYRIHDW